MFEDPNKQKNQEQAREEMNRKFEEGREAKSKDSELKQRVLSSYGRMIKELETGKVDPNSYRNKESFQMTLDEVYEIPKSSPQAFEALWEMKNRLRWAREEAIGKKARLDALKATAERDDIDDLNFDRIEKELDQKRFREYQNRIMRNMENMEGNEKLEDIDEEKELKESKKSDEPDRSDESEEPNEPDEPEEPENVEYQI